MNDTTTEVVAEATGQEPKWVGDWKDSVKSIIETGLLIARQREVLSTKEFRVWVVANIGLAHSAASKLIRVAQHPILSNPEYWDRLPAKWAFLYEVSYLTNDRILEIIQDGSIIASKKYQVWSARTDRSKFAISDPRSKVKTPDGVSIVDTVKVAMLREDNEGKLAKEIARDLGVSDLTYRYIKNLINAQGVEELSNGDRTAIEYALVEIERTKNVRRYYDKVRPILEKIWGPDSGEKNTRAAQKRIEDFITAVTVIRTSCDRAGDLEVPYLSRADVEMALGELDEARKSISKLMGTIRRV